MPTNPNTAEPLKPRCHWFQFRLRTLLIVVTLAGLACGYVGWQRRIVLERKHLRMLIEAGGRGGYFDTRSSVLALNPNMDIPDIPLVRRILGDEAIFEITWRYPVDGTSERELQRDEVQPAQALFPEASVGYRL